MNKIEKTELILVASNIIELNVDAIVNAANSSLLGGAGVDGAIHRAAGPKLLEECRKLEGCLPGEVKLTLAYNLPEKYIIHAVGPIWHGGDADESEFLRSCYLNALQLASDTKDITTLAFPAISCGVYNYPIAEAADIAISTVQDFVAKNNGLEKIYFSCPDKIIYRCYQAILS